MRSIQIRLQPNPISFFKSNHVDFQAQQIKPLFAQQFRRCLKSFSLRSQIVFNVSFLGNIQPLCFIPFDARVSQVLAGVFQDPTSSI